jgi:hypothetical protein
MPTFVSAHYVVNDTPPPDQLIAATAEDGTIWWLDDNCTQGDWLRFIEEGGTIEPAPSPEPQS